MSIRLEAYAAMIGTGLISGLLSGVAFWLSAFGFPWGMVTAPGLIYGFLILVPFHSRVSYWDLRVFATTLVSAFGYFLSFVISGLSWTNNLEMIGGFALMGLIGSAVTALGITTVMGWWRMPSIPIWMCVAGTSVGAGFPLLFVLFPGDAYYFARFFMLFAIWQTATMSPLGKALGVTDGSRRRG